MTAAEALPEFHEFYTFQISNRLRHVDEILWICRGLLRAGYYDSFRAYNMQPAQSLHDMSDIADALSPEDGLL